MEYLTKILQTQIYNGNSVADYLTLDFLVSVLGTTVSAVVILVLGFMISGTAQKRIKRLSQVHARLDATLFDFLSNIARYFILGFTLLFLLNTVGIQTTSIVAVVGAAGLAIGLALQGTLSNVAAGVMIIFFRPVKLGDFVAVNNVMGTIKAINLNFIEMADMSNVKVIIPNAEVWGNTIHNYSANNTRRAEWTFGVGYGANLADAQRIITDTIMADPRSFHDPEPFIQVNNLGDSSVDFLVRVWCSADEYFAYQADMKRAVKEALDAGKIDIPFPTRTIVNVSD
jgi:small conductance mechanosensitive channel